MDELHLEPCSYSILPFNPSCSTMPLTPKTPEVDWDRSSIVRNSVLLGKPSKTVKVMSARSDESNCKLLGAELATRYQSPGEKGHLVPNDAITKPKLILKCKPHNRTENVKLDESSLIKTLDSFETLSPSEFFNTLCACLVSSTQFPNLSGKISFHLPNLWLIALKSFSCSYLVEPAVAFLDGLTAFICTAGVDETFLISCTTTLIESLSSEQIHSSVRLALVRLLVSSMSKYDLVYEHVIEELLHQSVDTAKPLKVNLGSVSVNWISWFHVLLLYRALDSLQHPNVDSVSINRFHRVFSHLFAKTEQLFSIRKFGILTIVVEDVISMVKSKAFPFSSYMLKYLYGIILKLSILKLKSEHRMRLLEMGGSVVAILRPSEFASLTVEHCGEESRIPEPIRGVLTNRDNDPQFVLSRLSEILCGEGAENSHTSPVKFAELGPPSDKFVAILVGSLSDTAPLVRVRAVKELTKVIRSSDPLTQNSNFCVTMERLTKDVSPLVRDSVLEFLAQFSPPHELHEAFIASLPDYLHDNSLLVRKRAFKLSAKLILEMPCSETSFVLKSIMICDAAGLSGPTGNVSFDSLVNSWISPLTLAYHNSKKSHNLQDSRGLIKVFAADIARLINTGSVTGATIRKFFCQIYSGDQGVLFREIGGAVVSLLLEQLITCVSSDSGNSLASILAALVAVFSAETVVSEAQFRIICEFLKAENQSVVENTLQLLNIALAEGSPFRLKKNSHLVPSLFKLSFRGNENIIRWALDCIFKLSSSNPGLKMQLLRMYERIVTLLNNNANSDPANKCRYLFAAAYIARLGHEQKYCWDIGIQNIVDLIDRSWGIDKNLDNFCCISSLELVMADPILALRQPLCNIIMSCLNSSVFSLRLAVFRGFASLVKMGSNVESATGFEALPEASSDDISSTLCPVFQFYIDLLVGGGLCCDFSVVEVSVYLITEVLKRGLCHPRSILPFLLTVCQCPWDHLAQFAINICTELCESHGSFMPSSFGSFFKFSYRFQALLANSSRVSGYLIGENGMTQSCLKPVYELCRPKGCRRELLGNLLQELGSEDIDYVIFLSESLLELPLSSFDEIDLIGRALTDMIAGPITPNNDTLICKLVICKARNHFYHSYRLNDEYAFIVLLSHLHSNRSDELTSMKVTKDSAHKRYFDGVLLLSDMKIPDRISPEDLEKEVSGVPCYWVVKQSGRYSTRRFLEEAPAPRIKDLELRGTGKLWRKRKTFIEQESQITFEYR